MTEPHHVGNLTVTHCCLDSATPASSIFWDTREGLIYALVGTMRVYVNEQLLGTIGGRATVTDPLAHVMRFPAGAPHEVMLVLEGFAADCLLVSCDALPNEATKLPYCHWNDAHAHTVGSGTHRRRVVEVITPPSFHLSCGETLNEPGATSSWPPHASHEDLQAYHEGLTTWEEVFYVVCPAPAKAILLGLYPDRKQVNETITLNNGDIVPMPLGSHAVVASPGTWAYYAWFYCGNALQKAYNKWSMHVSTYLK